MNVVLYVFLILVIYIFFLLRLPRFGKLPHGERLERIKKSVNYINGAFQNQSVTPDLTEGATYFSIARDFFLGRNKRIKPKGNIPAIKTNLLNTDNDILVWFGHSSYFIRLDHKCILVDPVFCGYASPFSFLTRAFKGTDIYCVDDLPEIDYLFISHDHWDHLDFKTVKNLQSKVKKVICGLGTGEHLEYWGYHKNKIIECDWNEQIILEDGFKVYTVPARHFSGRRLKRNQSIWMSFILKAPSMNIFIGGDSGYDKHFAEVGKLAEIDLAILENGQYDKSWKHIHMMPEEVLTAAADLKAKRLFTVHNSKFAIANHSWDEPMLKITGYNKTGNIQLINPMIGEAVYLKNTEQKFSEWWKNIQ